MGKKGALSAVAGSAKSSEDDIEKTVRVIMDHLIDDDSGTDDGDDDASFAPPEPPEAEPAAVAPSPSVVELWSVDYDATVRIAYEAAGNEGDFNTFKTKYLEEASAMVAKKRSSVRLGFQRKEFCKV